MFASNGTHLVKCTFRRKCTASYHEKLAKAPKKFFFAKICNKSKYSTVLDMCNGQLAAMMPSHMHTYTCHRYGSLKPHTTSACLLSGCCVALQPLTSTADTTTLHALASTNGHTMITHMIPIHHAGTIHHARASCM